MPRHRATPAHQAGAHSRPFRHRAGAQDQDPGEIFPWRRLHEAGLGHWVAPAPIRPGPVYEPGAMGPPVAALQTMLAAYGYGLTPNGFFDDADSETWSPLSSAISGREQVDGIADASTCETLHALNRATCQRGVSASRQQRSFSPKRIEACAGARRGQNRRRISGVSRPVPRRHIVARTFGRGLSVEANQRNLAVRAEKTRRNRSAPCLLDYSHRGCPRAARRRRHPKAPRPHRQLFEPSRIGRVGATPRHVRHDPPERVLAFRVIFLPPQRFSARKRAQTRTRASGRGNRRETEMARHAGCQWRWDGAGTGRGWVERSKTSRRPRTRFTPETRRGSEQLAACRMRGHQS